MDAPPVAIIGGGPTGVELAGSSWSRALGVELDRASLGGGGGAVRVVHLVNGVAVLGAWAWSSIMLQRRVRLMTGGRVGPGG